MGIWRSPKRLRERYGCRAYSLPEARHPRFWDCLHTTVLAVNDVIPIPAEALRWLRHLAQARDENHEGWSEAEPHAAWEELLAIGLVEYRPAAFRLSDIGWWTLGRLVPQGTE